MINPIAGSEAAFGMEAVCFAEGLISPTTFRASRMRASAISVVEDKPEFHSEEPKKVLRRPYSTTLKRKSRWGGVWNSGRGASRPLSGPIALSIARPNSFYSRLGRASIGAVLSRRAAFAADSFLTSGRETASTLLVRRADAAPFARSGPIAYSIGCPNSFFS